MLVLLRTCYSIAMGQSHTCKFINSRTDRKSRRYMKTEIIETSKELGFCGRSLQQAYVSSLSLPATVFLTLQDQQYANKFFT